MKRYLVFFLNLFFLSLISVYATDFNITGKNVILYNLRDYSVIYEKNATDKSAIASLTKIATATIALENIDDLNEFVTITPKDFEGLEGYATAGFNVGDRVTYLDLLYGVLLPSGAEAVQAIVNNTLGREKFIAEMNNLVDKLGLINTKFSNPIGMDDEANYSTAEDVAKLLKYALENETFKTIFTTKEYRTTNNLLLKSTLIHYQDNLDISLIDGAKSGFTKQAGRCLASIATINDVDYLLVVINSSTDHSYNAIADSLTIYDYYSKNYSYQTIISEDTYIKEIPIKWSKEENYQITGSDNVEMYLENNTDLTYEYVGVEEIKINTKKDTLLGVVNVYDKDNLIYTSNVYLNKDISYYHPGIFLLIIILLFLLIIKLLRKRGRNARKN